MSFVRGRAERLVASTKYLEGFPSLLRIIFSWCCSCLAGGHIRVRIESPSCLCSSIGDPVYAVRQARLEYTVRSNGIPKFVDLKEVFECQQLLWLRFFPAACRYFGCKIGGLLCPLSTDITPWTTSGPSPSHLVPFPL